MDETAFEIDRRQVAVIAAAYPSVPLAPADAHPAGLGFLRAAQPFHQHAWDEAGRL